MLRNTAYDYTKIKQANDILREKDLKRFYSNYWRKGKEHKLTVYSDGENA